MAEVENMDGVLKALDRPVNPERLRQALLRASLLVEGRAKQNAQAIAQSGALAGSIASRVEGFGDEMVGIVYTPLEYAPYVEYGTGLFAELGGRKDVPWCYQDDKGDWYTTSGQHPQPFLRPALDESRPEIDKILREGLTKK